jgi:hypothetical protein
MGVFIGRRLTENKISAAAPSSFEIKTQLIGFGHVHQDAIADDKCFWEIDVIIVQNFGELFDWQLLIVEVREWRDPLDAVIGNNIDAPERIQKVVGSEISTGPAADVKNLFDAGRNSEVVKAGRGLGICTFIRFSNPFAEGSAGPRTFEYAQKKHSPMIATKEFSDVKARQHCNVKISTKKNSQGRLTLSNGCSDRQRGSAGWTIFAAWVERPWAMAMRSKAICLASTLGTPTMFKAPVRL